MRSGGSEWQSQHADRVEHDTSDHQADEQEARRRTHHHSGGRSIEPVPAEPSVSQPSSNLPSAKNENVDAAVSPSFFSSGEVEAVELVEKIGQGSCGSVYIGRDQLSSRKCAVKVICRDDDHSRWDRLLERMRLENELMLTFDHPNTVRGFGFVEGEDEAFLVMEHASGGDLLDFLNRHGRLGEDLTREMFRQIVSSVQYLHAHGWVHRDIKVRLCM